MKLRECRLENFGSYPELEFDFSDIGLALVSGETGSGKSTLMDAPLWILFGVTGKDDAADEVKAWDADGPTTGTLTVELGNKEITVYRARGKSGNDLYFRLTGEPIRGKSMDDTQKLLEKELGFSADTFLTASYMTQFSSAGSFFIAKAKERREVLEKIADQEFAIALAEKASNARKDIKKQKESTALELSGVSGRIITLSGMIDSLQRKEKEWEAEQAVKISQLEESFDQFDAKTDEELVKASDRLTEVELKIQPKEKLETALKAVKTKLADLLPLKKQRERVKEMLMRCKLDYETAERCLSKLGDDRCSKCGSKLTAKNVEKHRQELTATMEKLSPEITAYEAELSAINESLKAEMSLQEELSAASTAILINDNLLAEFDRLYERALQLKSASNPYGAQLAATKATANPHTESLKEAKTDLEASQSRERELKGLLSTQEERIASLGWIYDASFELRALLMARVVSQLESATNDYLDRYFDGALRVQFSLSGSDKLDIEIRKNGHICTFKRLSGGERTMLKLSFGLSLMRAVQDKAGVKFDLIQLDEPFNGLSESLKVKAFGLLQQIEKDYGSILVVEHSEKLQNQFDRVFVVTNKGGQSSICEQQSSHHKTRVSSDKRSIAPSLCAV